MRFEPDLLDDQAHLADADPGGMLPAVASAAAHVRTAHRIALECGLDSVKDRPRAIVVVGMGAPGLVGDILGAACGPGAAVPVVTVSSHRLPGWVGAADLVFAVSGSGHSRETLSAAAEAARRGCHLIAVARKGSPLESVAAQSSGTFVPVPTHGPSRSNLWLLAVPPLVAAASLGLLRAEAEVFERMAGLLEDVAFRCRPASESFVNAGKSLAMELAGTVPLIWGSSPVAAVAAHRMATQLGKNAKYPALHGGLFDLVAAFDGPLAERDVFADEATPSVRLVVLRDVAEDAELEQRRVLSVRLAQDRGVPVSEVTAEGEHPLERLATLIELVDYASVYLALGYGLDPTPVSAVAEMKSRISQ
ncbi:SIS domain-containing protein [Thermoactinospora rubra]|uniref:SIS domain-containing protein n=1 Tax=Thermoactinospora rubra TaxID=1088767 RepID=UPI000A0F9490|nr:SIS domain-containing protein [Thermoactinospora rubra]